MSERYDPQASRRSGGGAWLTVIFLALTFTLGLVLVSVNMYRTDVAYDLKTLDHRIRQQSELIAKLEVERNNLRSSYTLKSHAEKYGFSQAKPGQVRRLGDG